MSSGDEPRSIPSVMTGMFERATRKWTRQRKLEERHPAAIRYRASRLTTIPRTTQKEVAEEVMQECYKHVSGPRNLPAQARQIYYAARGKIMEQTDDRELSYGYFSQTLLPDYQDEHPDICRHWNVIYDARGHCEEPHTNRRFGCGTLEVDNYLAKLQEPEAVEASFRDAEVETIGPAGGYAAVFYVEKEGFAPLWKAVDLANRFDLFSVSNKGLSVTAARKLIDTICGAYAPPSSPCTTSTSTVSRTRPRSVATAAATRSGMRSRSSISGCGWPTSSRSSASRDTSWSASLPRPPR